MMDDQVLGTISVTVYLPADGSDLEIATGIEGHLDFLTQLGALDIARQDLYEIQASKHDEGE